MDDMDMDNTETVPIPYESPIPSEDSIILDKQMSRRMITETGDIIEAPILLKTTTIGIGLLLVKYIFLVITYYYY